MDEKGVRREKYTVQPPLVRKDLIAGMHEESCHRRCLMHLPEGWTDPFITPIAEVSQHPRLPMGRVAMVRRCGGE